jgi:hypothetical protein
LDVVVHNAGHMVFGPLEAFTPEQLAELYDVNVLSTQRVNRAALPQLRKQKQGLVVWVSSSSSAGGTPPYLAPYFAAKAGMDALAVVSARELTRWGIETSIIVPGAFTGGTNHFAHSGRPADTQRVAEYDNGPYKNFADDVMKGFASIVPPDADVAAVGEAIVKIVDAPFGKRPFRVHVDPTQDGAEVVNMVCDRVRPQQAVRDDAPPGVRDNRGRGRREVPIDDLGGNKETALLLKMPDSRVGPETAFLQGERRRILSAAMANLTPRIRRATELRELGELSTSPSCPSHAGERAGWGAAAHAAILQPILRIFCCESRNGSFLDAGEKKH